MLRVPIQAFRPLGEDGHSPSTCCLWASCRTKQMIFSSGVSYLCGSLSAGTAVGALDSSIIVSVLLVEQALTYC